ncbi:hypothetical protein AB0E21_10420 [Streptomyces sp. NPDC047967]|uniref:hypothetical protein n=1 Tax=Streptomyces sp. NPDC047967 TaxID=3154924 RepID=UPI003405F8EA
MKFTDDSGSYEQGTAQAMALDEATCSWSRQWIKANGEKDSKAETEALKVLEGFRTRKAYLGNDSSYHDLMESVQSKAALGDAGPMAQYVQQNCNQF